MRKKTKSKTKKKIFIGIIIGLMICSIFSMIAQFGLATQDDEDIEVTISATLQTDSSEILSTLMPIGTYSMFDTPELDTGSFTHDATRIEVTNLQYPSYNSSTSKEYNKNDGLIGNFSVNTTEISQYTLSAPFDTTIQINISYTRNYSLFSEYTLHNLSSVQAYPVGLEFYNGYFYVSDYNQKAVWKWTSDLSTKVDGFICGGSFNRPLGIAHIINYVSLHHGSYLYWYDNNPEWDYGGQHSFPEIDHATGICVTDDYYYITDDTTGYVYVYEYDNTFVTSYNLGALGGNDEPYGIESVGNHFYVSDADGCIYEYNSEFSSLLTSYDLESISGNGNPRGMEYYNDHLYVVDSTDCCIYEYGNGTLFDETYIENFEYQKLGVPYYENYTLIYDDSSSNFTRGSTSGYVIYYFESSMFSNYTYVNDIVIPQQNLSLIIDLEIPNVEINMTIVVSSSTCEWKVPTEVTLTINSEEIIDSTYNSGWISLSTYPTSLVITATELVYFRLNITVDFSFTFNLEIVSKTYLKKSFELESDHQIELEQVDFDDGLNIKKVYLNNIDWGSNNPTVFSPSVSMDQGNLYTLEILLIDEIYLPLSYIYNNLGSGTSNIYMSGISNTLTYSNINGNQMYGLTIPAGWYVEEGYLTFSNLDYTPSYTPDYSQDESGYGYGSSSYGDEDVSWGERYYQLAQNGSMVAESGNSGYESVWEEYFATLNGYMSHTYGSLDGQNSTYTVNDYLYMQNIFPSNFSYEQWNDWVLTYNSDYTSSSWDDTNVELLSELNTYLDNFEVFSNNFTMTNGTAQHGDYSDIDNNYGNFTSTEGTGESLEYGHYPATFSFEDDEFGDDPDGWTLDEAGGTINVIPSMRSHTNVIELHDTSATHDALMYDTLESTQTSGTVEFWVRFDVTNERQYVWVGDGGYSDSANIYWDHTGAVSYYDGSQHNVDTYSADTWYHYKIEFDTGDDWHLWIDGVSKDGGTGYTFNGNPSDMDQVTFKTHETYTDFYFYVDAVGYSWDTDYSLGDNYYPECYDNNTYKGTYSFTDEIEGENPEKWTTYESGGTIQIIDEEDEYSKVAELHDTGTYVEMYDAISQTSGTVECWIRTSDATYYNLLYITDDTNGGGTEDGVWLGIDHDKFYYYDSSSHDIDDAYDDTWYHIKIEFDTTDWHLWIDGVSKDGGSGYNLHGSVSSFTEVEFLTWTSDTNYYYYVDGIGYDWNEYYTIGDNEDELDVCDADYSASYSFTDDTEGNDPSGWTVDESGGTINILDIMNGHHKIVELDDTSGANSIELTNEISRSTGTVELWIQLDQTNAIVYFGVWDGTISDSITLLFSSDGNLKYDDGSTHTVMSYSADIWYHIKIEFDTGDDWHLWIDGVSKDGGSGYNFRGSPSTMDNAFFQTTNALESLSYIDAVGYSWLDNYTISDNKEIPSTEGGSGNATISFTTEFSFNLDNLMANETLDYVRLYYSYYTNRSFEFASYIFNFDTSVYEILNQSTNADGFHEIYLTLNSSYYNHSYYTIRLRFNSSYSSSYQLHLDQLCIELQRIKTSGEIYASIDKEIDFAILNRYDAYSNYQDLYNVTIEFLYRYSNYTKYDELAQFDYYNTSYTLTKDENWHEASLNFEFNSSDINSFNLLFNITNGLLEIKNLNYTSFFECLHNSGYNQIYQRFRYIPSLSLNDLQRLRGNWILNFTFNFTASSDLDYYTFYNSFNYSLLSFQIYVNTENGWEAPVSYDYNTTQSNIAFSFNITQYIAQCGASEFNDLYLEFYLAGNPSEFELDDLILFDFDSEFYQVNALWITDTLVVSHQDLSVHFSASDRYLDRVEVNETYDSVNTLIYNMTIINNTLYSINFYNISAGFYEWNLTFYDNYSNWERWSLNFTIMNGISISTAYKNPIFINEVNTISVYLNTEYSINRVWYENSSDYILQYDNSSYPLYEYEFNFTYSSSVETTYNISVKVSGEYNDTFWCNITILSVLLRTTMLDINNLHYSYYQDEQMNVTFILRDLYNNPVGNKLLNFTIEDPNGLFIVNESDTTNSFGNFSYNLPFNISYTIGFYHLNCSFSGDTNYSYVWNLQSFQVRPILRSVNSTDINLQVNGHPVVSNYIQINNTHSFTLSNNNTAVFDMSIYVKMNYTESISYYQSLSYGYSYTATSDISSLTFSSANLTSYPGNFTNYYYNLAESTNYVIYNNNFSINDLVGDTLYNDNSFSIMFTYLDTTEIERIQLTETPRTDTDEVQFKEYLTANRTFRYWYFHNSMNITTVSLYHNRTSSTVSYSDFTIENSNYYFEKSCLSGDLFTATTTYNPGWDVSYEILTQNGTYSEIQISYKASLDITNVTLVLDLNDDNLYAENWSHNGDQSLYTFILEIPGLNFTTSTQTLTINGNSSVPYAEIAYFENEEDYDFNENDYDDDDMAIWYKAYLEFPYFSQAFIIQGRNASWILDGIHYDDDEYDITDTGYFENPGWGSGISSAYLRFYAHPIGRVARYVNYNPETTEVVYRINTLLDIQNAEFEFYIEDDEAYTIIDIYFEGDELDHDEYEQVKLAKIDGKDYYRLLNIDLERGVNKIHIKYREEHLEYHSWILFAAIALTIGFLGFYAWKLNVLIKSKKGKRLSRSDIIRLIIMPWRIKSEKVEKRRKKNELKGSALKTWSELKEDAAELKHLKDKKKAEKKKKKKKK